MAKKKSYKNRRKLLKILVVIVIIILIVAGVIYYRSKHDKNNLNAVTKKSGYSATVSKSVKSSGTQSPGGSLGQGGATDQNGQTSSTTTTNSSQWTTASSGQLTVEQPAQNALVKNGDTLSGTAKFNTVQFRIIDNSVGVVAQGSLNVVGGNFSGVLNFRAQSTSGRLDVFSYDPTTGAEINEVQIPITLSP